MNELLLSLFLPSGILDYFTSENHQTANTNQELFNKVEPYF